jgi:hypothetical protein
MSLVALALNSPRCANGSEDRRVSILRRYGNDTRSALENFVARRDNWLVVFPDFIE